MLNYNHLYYFHTTALEGSVASAATHLRPTVSEQIRSLERVLGVTLFERLSTGLRLTESGKLAFEHTSIMFRAGERLTEALGQSGRVVPATLRIGLSGAVGRAISTKFLLPLLALDECFPSIRSSDSVELLRDLRSNELDLILCESEPPAAALQGLQAQMVDQLTLVAVGSPQLIPDEDWQNVGLVHYRASSAFRWDVETYLETNSLRPKIVAESDDALFLLEAAATGGYVVFVPRSVARDAVTAGRLKIFARVKPVRAGLFAVFQDGEGAVMARRAVELLIKHQQAQGDD